MRKITTLLAAAIAAYALLPACSGGSQSLTSLPNPNAGQNALVAHPEFAHPDFARTGIAPSFFNLIRPIRPAGAQVRPAAAPADLYVDDDGTNAVDIFSNKKWKPAGGISGPSSGLDGPNGNYADKSGRLFVANYLGDNITEYAPGASTPMFTYNAGMVDPVNVSVDRHGNVYEADFDNGNGSGFVNEYHAGVNALVASCAPGGGVEGVAIDGFGNAFVSVEFKAGGGAIFEYSGGFKSCAAKNLGISLGFAGGIAIDSHGNLLVTDQNPHAPAVDVIPPPYTAITGSLGSGYVDPFHIALNKKNNQLYVTDFGNADVRILGYPDGANLAVLNSNQGLSSPYGAVDGQNYIP